MAKGELGSCSFAGYVAIYVGDTGSRYKSACRVPGVSKLILPSGPVR